MYYHKKCDGNIFASQRIEMFSGLTVTTRGVIVAGVGRLQISLAKTKLDLICNRCEKITRPEEIYSRCMQCGDTFSITDLYIPHISGGHYCKSCINEYYPEENSVKVSSAIVKIAE